MKRSVVLLSCIILAGCNATTGRPAATVTAAADDDATCRSYGAVRGSPAYVQCRTSLAEGQVNRSQAKAAACEQRRANLNAEIDRRNAVDAKEGGPFNVVAPAQHVESC